MTGHEPLLDMRRQGWKPAHVSLNDRAWAYPWWKTAETLPFADVGIAPGDDVGRLDLRFTFRLPVIVDQADPYRLRRLVLACEDAGAARVYGFTATQAICTHGEDQTWRNF